MLLVFLFRRLTLFFVLHLLITASAIPFYELYVLVLQARTHKMILIFAILKISVFEFFQPQVPGSRLNV